MTLRPYQQQAIADIRAAYRQGNRGVLYVAPVGSGKTSVFSDAISRTVARGGHAAVIVHHRELVDQALERLRGVGVKAGVIAAGLPPSPDRPVQVCMVQSLVRRELPWEPTLLVVDEAHLAAAQSYRTIMDRHPDAWRLLVTATPYRLDGQGWEPYATAIVEAPQIPDLVAQGYLVPSQTWSAPVGADLDRLPKRCGEYVLEEVAARLDKPHLVGEVVHEYLAHARGRACICFASSVRHSQHIAATFRNEGIEAIHLDATSEPARRARALSDLRSGALAVISNFGLLTEGVDIPVVSCIILARATASTALAVQMQGRGLRVHPGKMDCCILDHGQNYLRHGLIDEPRSYTLAGRARAEEEQPQPCRTCPACCAVYSAHAPACPRCGAAPPPPKPREIPKAEQRELERVQHRLIPEARCPLWCPEDLWRKLERKRIAAGHHPRWSYGAAHAILERYHV